MRAFGELWRNHRGKCHGFAPGAVLATAAGVVTFDVCSHRRSGACAGKAGRGAIGANGLLRVSRGRRSAGRGADSEKCGDKFLRNC